MAKKCFTRETSIKLADGNSYIFRALPNCKETTPILTALMRQSDEAEMLKAIVDGVYISLSYDQEPAVVEEIMSSGMIRIDMNDETFKSIMKAMVNQG